VEPLRIGGPSARRIDVAFLGDGFVLTSKEQKQLGDWAELCLKVLFADASFEEYGDYFNFHHVRLASAEEGVDEMLSDEEKAKIDERNKRRRKDKKYEWNTALDCKAAGPQGQVMSDSSLVYKWLAVADRAQQGVGDDGLVIVFAKFGKLGMGGGGIANCGRPDKSVTVHEFGHAFVGLLDEYANAPGPPSWAIRAPNATTDPENPPWKHFLDAKVKGVDVLEGGATFQKGVWRPAASCAMNSAGNAQGYCPVCREASVLRIYSYIDPIDASSPATETDVDAVEGGDAVLSVVPMQPRKHDLDVTWHVEVGGTRPAPKAPEEGSGFIYGGDYAGYGGVGSFTGGDRRLDEEHTKECDAPPTGDLSRLAKEVKTRGEPTRHQFALGRLAPGRYKITVRVHDATPFVLKDEKHLLEARRTWWVTVRAKP
jgi:hypothetical protein